MLTDARSIAVDGAGRIYVGEYTGGRIQVFDPDGKFLIQWMVGDRKTILRGLAADRKGTVMLCMVEGSIFTEAKPERSLVNCSTRDRALMM
jgi:streptogramin lyase